MRHSGEKDDHFCGMGLFVFDLMQLFCFCLAPLQVRQTAHCESIRVRMQSLGVRHLGPIHCHEDWITPAVR
jgi:hypothetical protein